MKKILLILSLLLITIYNYAQTSSASYSVVRIKDSMSLSGFFITLVSNDTTLANASQKSLTTEYAVKNYVTNHISNASTLSYGGAITLQVSGLQGVNPNTTNIVNWINSVFYPTHAPTSSLTITYSASTSSNLILENTSASTLNMTLNWSASRDASTDSLSSIVVATDTQTFSQPAQPGTVSGTQAITVNTNTTSTFNNIVTTTDGKSNTSIATVTFQNKWFYGFNSSNAFSNSLVHNLTNFFSTSRTAGTSSSSTLSMGTPSGSQYGWIAFDATLDAGNIDQIWVNGLNQTGQFTRSTVLYTNASGYITNYIIYVQNTPTSSTYSFYIK